jgi:hypothetical protein
MPRDLTKALAARRAFRTDPALYARVRLGMEWTPDQIRIAESVRDNQRTMVLAGHAVGKSALAGGLINWWFDTNIPGCAITTAPTNQQVRDVLWTEVRRQRRGLPGLLPKFPRMEGRPGHYAVGTSPDSPEAFQGRHSDPVLVVFDEAVGVAREFLDAGVSMMSSPRCRMLALCNPTDPTSWVKTEADSGRWNVIRLSCIDHPNVQAELQGLPPPFPAAVSRAWVEKALAEYGTRCDGPGPGHVEFPAGVWWDLSRDPRGEPRIIGRWPSQSEFSLWSDWLLDKCRNDPADIHSAEPPTGGCDVARGGADRTVFAIRRGAALVHLECRTGWNTTQVADRLVELGQQYGEPVGMKADAVPWNVDDCGVGGGVVDRARDVHGLAVNPVNAACASLDERFPLERDRLWFAAREQAEAGAVSFAALSESEWALVRAELASTRYSLASKGRRQVEKKDDVKKRIGVSPDVADAVNLAYLPVVATTVGTMGGKPTWWMG